MSITVNSKTWFEPQDLSEQALAKAVIAFHGYFMFDSPVTQEMADEFFNYIINLKNALRASGLRVKYEYDYQGIFKHQSTLADSKSTSELFDKLKQFVTVTIEQSKPSLPSFDELVIIATKANDDFYKKNDWLYTNGAYQTYFDGKQNSDVLFLIQDYFKYIVTDYLIGEFTFFDEQRLLNWDYPQKFLQLYFSEDGSEMTNLADLEDELENFAG